MLLIRTSNRERLTADTAPRQDYPASSVGQFHIRTDGTARFDRHHHHVAELWFVAAGAGTRRHRRAAAELSQPATFCTPLPGPTTTSSPCTRSC